MKKLFLITIFIISSLLVGSSTNHKWEYTENLQFPFISKTICFKDNLVDKNIIEFHLEWKDLVTTFHTDDIQNWYIIEDEKNGRGYLIYK